MSSPPPLYRPQPRGGGVLSGGSAGPSACYSHLHAFQFPSHQPIPRHSDPPFLLIIMHLKLSCSSSCVVAGSQLDPNGADRGATQPGSDSGVAASSRSEMVLGGQKMQVPMQHVQCAPPQGWAGREGEVSGEDLRLPAKGPGVQQWAEGWRQVPPAQPELPSLSWGAS